MPHIIKPASAWVLPEEPTTSDGDGDAPAELYGDEPAPPPARGRRAKALA